MDFFTQLLNLIFALYIYFSYVFVIVFIIFSKERSSENLAEYTGGISVVIPSYNELHTIQKTIESVIKCKHDFGLEIIVVDDGIGNEISSYLREKFPFEIYKKKYKKYIKTKAIRHIYFCNVGGIPIYVIDKKHGFKADALNAAISLVNYDYFLCLDADSLLDENALAEIHKSINTDTLAVGGRVQPYLASEDQLLPRLFTMAQVYEYARIFNIVRVAFNNLHMIPLISGTISLFHTKTVRLLGGYDIHTKGEDFELTLRMQNYAKENGGELQYCKSSVVYTQAPFNLTSIIRQRTRWYQGMIEVLKKYKNLFYSKSVLSILLHGIRLYEQYGFIFEISLIVKYHQYLPIILLIEIIFNIIYTLYAQYMNNQKILMDLFSLSIFGLAFHFLNSTIKLLYYFRKKKSGWDYCKRRPYETIRLRKSLL